MVKSTNKPYNDELQRQTKRIQQDYGFTANPSLPVRKRILNRLLHMSVREFFAHCNNLSFHNLCVENNIPTSAAKLLGLGLKYCICDRKAPTDLSDFQFERFRKSIRTKYQLLGLEDAEERTYEPKIYVKNPNWTPETASPEVEEAINAFETALRNLVISNHRRSIFQKNLTRHELQQLRALRSNKDIIILPSDKNLGPVALDTTTYVQKVLTEHLLNDRQYKLLTTDEAKLVRHEASTKLWNLVNEHAPNFAPHEQEYFNRRYLQRRSCRVPIFYGSPKIHKPGVPLRPIVSCVNSEMEILSIFLDYQLQRVLPLCKYYLRDSWQLLEKLKDLGPLPDNARLITVDAVGMYNNIDTDLAIQSISKWLNLHKHEIPNDFPTQFVLEGLRLIMTTNVFEFDDISCLQKNGTAMGTCVAVMYATIYYSYYEETHLAVDHGITLYVRFIDDVFLIQNQTPGSHAVLANDFNNYGPPGKRLQWLSSGPQTQVTFLDLTLKIVANRIEVKTYEKPLNLHLYIPAFSAHSSAMAKGMIYGMLRRFWLQNTQTNDYIGLVRAFYHHLLERGYDHDFLQREFLAAAHKLSLPIQPIHNGSTADRGLAFLHVKYHPFQITRKDIQTAYQQTCADTLLKAKSNTDGLYGLQVKRLIVAQSRASNLRDRLCRTQLELPEGKRASSHIHLLQNE